MDCHKKSLLIASLNHRKTKALLYYLFISVAMVILNSEIFALNTAIGINAGYDNNVNSTPEASGSSFTACHLHLNHMISHEKAFGKSSIYLNSFYKNYSRFEDNLSVNAGAYYSCFPDSSRLMMLGLIEGGLYRDEENVLDELNRIKTGGQLKFFYNGRITFEFSQFFNWNDYLESVEELVWNESGTESGNTDVLTEIKTEKRNDCYMSSDLGMSVRLHPMLNMTMFALYNRLLSNIQTEAYDGFGSSIFFRFSPDPSWGISTEASLWKNNYDDSADRTDLFRSAGLLINYFLDRYELFIRIDLMDNNSSLEYETYNRLVTQCGFSIFF